MLGSQLGTEQSQIALHHAPFESCSTSLPSLPNATFVLLNLPFSVSLYKIEAEVRCWQGLGAEGVVVVQKFIHVPGGNTYLWDNNMRFDVSIPVLHAADSSCMRSVIHELHRSPSLLVMAIPTLTLNLWQEQLFDSAAFMVLFRVVFPGISCVIACLALDGFVGHSMMLMRPASLSKHSSWLGLLGCISLIVGATIRLSMFALGPFRSSSRVSFETQEYLANLIFGMSGEVSCVAAALLRHWSTFGKPSPHSNQVERGVLIFGLNSIVLSFLITVGRIGHKRVGSMSIETLGWLTMVVGTGMTTVTFSLSGRAFLKRLNPHNLTKTQWRAKTLRRAALWIIAGAGAQIFVFIASLLNAVSSDMVNTPWGVLLTNSIMFFGLSITGFAHALSFRPITSNSFTLIRLMKKWFPAKTHQPCGAAKAIFCPDEEHING